MERETGTLLINLYTEVGRYQRASNIAKLSVEKRIAETADTI
jgi:hypothetical protein